MQPNQSHQPSGPGPQPPYRPPEYTVNPNISARHGGSTAPTLQQHPSGQYEVVPTPASGSNNGSTGHNPYEFIFAPQPKKPKLGLSLGNDRKSMFVWLGVLIGGAGLVLAVVAILLSALGPKSSTPGLTAIAQRQQEIIRIADDAASQATSQDVLNFVTTADVSVASSQQQVLVYLAKHSVKLSPVTLALDKSDQTDALLANAVSTSTYDSAVVQNLTDQLQTYETLLQNTAKQTSNSQTRALLQSCFTAADRLLKQAKAVTPAN